MKSPEETKPVSYIAKTVPAHARTKDLFQKEVACYNNFLPHLEAMRATVANLRPLAFPKCLLASLENEVILLQNLKTCGFVMRPKFPKGLDKGDCEAVMKELAKLHASGHAFLKMFKGGISQFLDEFPDMEPQPFFRSPIKDMDAGLRGLEKGALEAVKAVVTEEPLQKRLAAFIEQKDTLVDRCHVSREGLAGTFPVIQHGDLWNNNILFKDSDETAAEDVEVKFIDLQFVKYSEVATPHRKILHTTHGADLVYFFWSSTTPELRRNHEVELLRLYHHHLNMEAHAMLNEDIDLSFDSLKNSYERLLPFGFTMACIHAQLQIVGANNENSTAPFNFGEFDGHNMDSKLDMMTARMTADLKDFVSKSRPALNRINSLVLEASTRGII